MKLFDEKRAPNPRRVRIFLAEKNISVPCEQIDLMQGAHKTSSFAEYNPYQQIPVLILDDGTALSESVAICRYFEALYPDPPLFGTSPIEIAMVEMWNRRAEIQFFFPVAQCVRHGHPAFAVLESPQIQAWAEVNRPRVLKSMELFDKHLENHRFLAGDRFSIADITAFVAAEFMKLASIRVPDDAAYLRRWLTEVKARPSATA